MQTTQQITLKGLRKIAKKQFRNRRSSIIMNYGGFILFLGGFLAWVYTDSTASVAFALPVAVGMISLIYSITKEAKYLDSIITKWAEGGMQLPEELK